MHSCLVLSFGFQITLKQIVAVKTAIENPDDYHGSKDDSLSWKSWLSSNLVFIDVCLVVDFLTAKIYRSALVTYLRQEIDRMNRLLRTINKTLTQLCRAVKGEIIMSETLDDIYNSILEQRVPTTWKVHLGSVKADRICIFLSFFSTYTWLSYLMGLLSRRLVGTIGARNYVRSSHSQRNPTSNGIWTHLNYTVVSINWLTNNHCPAQPVAMATPLPWTPIHCYDGTPFREWPMSPWSLWEPG